MSLAPAPLKFEGRSDARTALHVPLVVEGRCASTAQPVTVGLPFPRGALVDGTHLTLCDANGRVLAVQAEPLARWPDGSVKWLLLDFILPSVAAGSSQWLLAPAEGANGKPPALRIDETGPDVVIGTGTATFHVGRTSAALTRVLIGGRDVLDPASTRLRLSDAAGTAAAPRVESAAIEARGPVRATVRLQGVFGGGVPCRFVVRLDFFAETALVRARLTVHNPNRAEHPGGLWDLGDPGSMLFRDLSLEFGLHGPARTTWAAEVGQAPERVERGGLEIYQDSSGGDNWRSRNHVNRDGQVPLAFRGYRVRVGEQEKTGLRASPIVAVEGTNGSLTAAVPEFWQQFPKAIQVQGPSLRLQLFPQQFGDLHELQGGEQKTHAVWLHFALGSPEPLADLGWAYQPACVRASPEWYAASGAAPGLPPSAPAAEGRLDAYLADILDGPRSFFAGRERIDEYGWRNFGEVYADHEEAYCPTPPPIVSHYNNQFDVVHGLLLQFFRTGDARWRELADPLARHVGDIDLYHTDRDKAAYNGGLFWFTDHYLDAGTCTHRTYSRRNCKPGDASYGGGPDSQHNFATGLLHYHYLTGDPVARDAVVSLADWVVRMDDGRHVRLLGLLDDGPTGLASRTADPGYHGPGRGCGNSIHVLLDGHALTGRPDYLDKAEELIRRSVHPADDVAALDLLNAEKRWSYTVHLSAVARYLDVKAEAGAVDFMYAYTRAALLHYAAWLVEHERPYFDRPEHLEYPTETWGAQEMRKANVLRLAAAHADEPLRSRLLKRGAELADRAWHDVLRFETRHVARAAAVLMVEGTRDLYFRAHEPPPAPRPTQTCDFGPPEAFVPQRHRAQAMLRTPGGLVRALLRLADPRNWRAYWS